MTIDDIHRLIRIAAAHRQMQEQGRLLRQAVTGLIGLGLSIDDILCHPSDKAVELPRPSKRKAPPPPPVTELIHDTKTSRIPTSHLFKLIRDSGWDYSGAWKDYTPDEVRQFVADYADAPDLYLTKLPRNRGRGAHAIIANWYAWRAKLNDPVNDLFREPAR